MDFDRTRALGRWSEWVGESAVSQDILMRRLGIGRAARADLNVTSPPAQAMVSAHTAGINYYLSTLTEDMLPAEYKLAEKGVPDDWEDWHTFALYKMRNLLMGHLDMKVWRARVVMELGPERAADLFLGYPEGALVTTPPNAVSGVTAPPFAALAAVYEELNPLHEIDCGSNSWVVSGERSATGLPLLAGDSHRGLDTPSVYYRTCSSPFASFSEDEAKELPAAQRSTSSATISPSRATRSQASPEPRISRTPLTSASG